ncbi:MAG: hypothetical protein SVT52_06205 [Planctomycetota bacterium]|nr:hypothetical protein [Planctomycetota bacterium]
MSIPAESPPENLLPQFESLEQRLLLTTLMGGEFFIYLNSQGEAVRVDLDVGATEDSEDAIVELFTYDDNWGGVHDLVGIPGDDTAGLRINDQQQWGDGVEDIVEYDVENGTWSWINYEKDEFGNDSIRGAETEIFSIYIAMCTPDTVLTISTLTSSDIPESAAGWPAWYNDINTWDSTTLPLLAVIAHDPVNVFAPAGSGGVIVGTQRSPEAGVDGDKLRHIAVANADPETGLSNMGWFPGGNLAPGVSVFGEPFQMINLPVGSDVHSIASDSAGNMFVVDLSAFQGVIVNDDPGGEGFLGEDVSSLASDSAGTFYAVDNALTPLINSPTNSNIGANITGITAGDAGLFYAVDEETHHLLSWSVADGLTDIGELIDANQSQYRYEGVCGLDYNSSSSLMYAIGFVVDTDPAVAPDAPDPSGPFLITIDVTNAQVTSRMLINDGNGTFTAMAFDPAGTCFAVNGATNELVTIDPADGAITVVGTLLDGATSVTGVVGIDFLGQDMYAVTGDHLYRVSPATAACTDRGAVALPADMGSLAYDPTRPGSLYTAVDIGTNEYRFCRIPLGASLVWADVDGVSTLIDVLVDSTEDTWVWQNVYALDYNNGDGLLYGVGTAVDLDTQDAGVPPAGRRLITIDPVTGLVTDVGALTGAADVQSLVFDGGGTLYGLDATTDELYDINPATGAGVLAATVDVSNLEGIEFVNIGANEVLYGVTADELYVFDLNLGAGTATGTLLGDTGQTTLSSLAFDGSGSQDNILWSTASDGTNFYLTRVDLSSVLVALNGWNPVTRQALLFDAAEPAYAYVGIHALEFGPGDVLYGVGTIVNLDPGNVADPASFGPYLITIDTTTGLVTQVVPGTPLVTDLSSLAYDATATWYGVVPDVAGDQLVTVNMATSATTLVGVLTAAAALTGVTGLDFEDGSLYAVTDDSLYEVDAATAVCTLSGLTPFTGLSSLTGDETDTQQLWSTALFGDEYYLVSLATDAEAGIQDIGRVIMAGTLAGAFTTDGNVEVIEMGFLFGNVLVGHNLDTLIARVGGGAVPVPAPTNFVTPDESRIWAGGVITGVYSRSETLYSAIEADNDLTIADPDTLIMEHEVRVAADAHDAAWLAGDLVDHYNDSMETAQFLNHPSGDFTLFGSFPSDPYDSLEDWYALPLMAGQTIVMDGMVISCAAYLYDWDGNWMDSFGFETIEDEGLASIGQQIKPMTFTAPSAGVYYLMLYDLEPRGGAYLLNFTNGPAAALGGVSVVGDYYGMFTGTGSAADKGANIAAKWGGDLGGVVITGSSYYTVAYAAYGGNLVAFQAGEIGTLIDGTYTTNTIISDSNIGRVASTSGFLDANILAGSNFYNPNAYIQNIYAATDYIFANAIMATGSIGVIEIENDLQYGVLISVNSNDTNYTPGMGSRLDLLDIGGDYHCYGGAMLSHGPGGDIGFVYVGGTILVDYGDWIGAVTEELYENGETSILNDDGGGRTTVLPVETTLLDENGAPVLDENGDEVTYTPTYSFCYIPVDDVMGGVGGVVANFRVNGSAVFNTTGVVQVSSLDISDWRPGGGGDPYTSLTFAGGETNIYYLHDHHTHPDYAARTLDIHIDGNLVSANLGQGGWGASSSAVSRDTTVANPYPVDQLDIEKLTVTGDLGAQTGTTGAWLHGWDDAEVIPDVDDGSDADTVAQYYQEAQYGWFHGKHNGVQIWGNLENLRVNGSLGDMRVKNNPRIDAALAFTGRIGTVRVNADNYTAAGDWDGICGILWARRRIDEAYVGDGLADDGGADVARAAIMSGYSIGRVEVNGPYFVVDGQAYHELNGSIIGFSNDIGTTFDEAGNPVVTTYHGVGQVIGLNGARMTANVVGMNLLTFRCYGAPYAAAAGIGTVSFSGVGAEIEGSEITGDYVQKVYTSINSNGISNSHISGHDPVSGEYAVGEVIGGGPGMNRVFVSVTGSDIGTVKGLGANADILSSVFVSTAGMHYIGAKDLYENGIHMPGTVGTMNATHDMISNTVMVGAVDQIKVSNDFELNSFTVAGKIGPMDIGGAFIDSYLSLQGPSIANLKSLVVNGDISGEIVCAGKIGQIISRNGGISADISTIVAEWDGDINLIQTAEGFTGKLYVSGSMGRFISGLSLGESPAQTGETQTFDILGDLNYLKVGSRSVSAHLYAGINVGGDVGTMDISGTLYANVMINGSMKSLIVGGQMGGLLNFTENWTGADGNAWPGVWTFNGDIDQLASQDIQSNRGRVAGDVAAAGTVMAYTRHHARSVDQSVLFNISADGMGFGLIARRSDTAEDTYYLARVVSGGAVGDSLRIYKVVGGVETELADTGLLYDAAGTDFMLRFACTKQGSNTLLQVKMWDASVAEPAAWSAEVTDNEAALQGVRGRFGLYYGLSDVIEALIDNYTADFSRGRLTVMGKLNSMKFPTTGDLFADLAIGGSIKRLNLTGGSILGDLTSRYGAIEGINLNGGSVIGNVTAVSIGNISIRNGNVMGDVTATDGNIKSLSVTGGNLDAEVTARNGRIQRLSVNTGDILPGHTIEAEAGFGTVSIRNGDLLSDLISGRNIKSLTIRGSDIGSALNPVMISAETGIDRVQTDGAVVNSVIRSGSKIGQLNVNSVQDSIISAGWHIGSARIGTNVTGSHILAGYDVGPDGAVGGGDDVAHSGDFKSLDVGGNFNTSVAAAGIDPGASDDFTNLADNTDNNGVSSILRANVRGAAVGSFIQADTYIDPNAPAGAVVPVKNDPVVAPGGSVDFGPETANNTLTIGNLTLTLTGAGLGSYHAATNTLYLNRTTTRSNLRLDNTGANIDITVVGAEDAELSGLQTSGAVTLADTTVHGAIKRLTAANIANGAVWNLYGGIGSASLGGMTNVNATTGELGTWRMDALTGGFLTADAIKGFFAAGSVTGNLTALLGNARIDIRGGDLNGDVTILGTATGLAVSGAVTGVVNVTNGDLQTFRAGSLSGRVEAALGLSRTVTITGAFSGSYRTGMGIGRFASDTFSGLLSTSGDLTSFSVRNAMTGQARSGGSIRTASFGSMNGALVTAAADFQNARITGDMLNSWLFAGFDPGDAGYDPVTFEDGNVAIDAWDAPLVAAQQDSPLGGSFRSVRIGGDMTDSTISAAVDPGVDGYCGTPDDVVSGIGYVNLVRVSGAISGTSGGNRSYGVIAASEMPTVYYQRSYPFVSSGSAQVGTMWSAAGNLTVIDVNVLYNSLTIYFDHPVNTSTLGTVYTGMVPESFTLLVSVDDIFDPATDTVISAVTPHTLVYDTVNCSVTMTLSFGASWQTLGLGNHYQLTLDGAVVADNRGFLLDGEYEGTFPSGDGEPGGDFVYEFTIGQTVLSSVPSYEWWFGCAPTAAGMLAGYYDGLGYGNLIVGDASTQTDEVNEAIASSGDGTYFCDSSGYHEMPGTVHATVGTGHIGDYAIYDGIDDSGGLAYPDMSSVDPGGAHVDDCLADFMYTSFSSEGLTMGGSLSPDIGPGVEAFFAYKGYTANSSDLVFGVFGWDDLIVEIDNDRPVLLGVDAGGTGGMNHAVVAVGYDTITNQYACYNTWTVDDPLTPANEALQWYDFNGVAPGQDFGIGMAITVVVP